MSTTTSRDLVIKTLNQQRVERVPRDLWASPTVESTRNDELAEINLRYPSDILHAECKSPGGKRAPGKTAREGQYTDAWGCTWQTLAHGALGELRHAPLGDSSKIAAFRPPTELVDAARFARITHNYEATTRFVLAASEAQPFQRLLALRGKDAALADLKRGSRDIRNLLGVLHEFFCREVQRWADSGVDGVSFREDWATAEELLVSPEIWRDLFRPLYRDYCNLLHAHDKFVFFQSSGNIAEIFAELVRLGADAVHVPWAAMNVERLAKRYRGRITFWGGIDQDDLLIRGTPEEIRQAVQCVRRALDFGAGGVIAQCPWEAEVPLARIAMVFEQWASPLPMHV